MTVDTLMAQVLADSMTLVVGTPPALSRTLTVETASAHAETE
jgi:hypothetical protein